MLISKTPSVKKTKIAKFTSLCFKPNILQFKHVWQIQLLDSEMNLKCYLDTKFGQLTFLHLQEYNDQSELKLFQPLELSIKRIRVFQNLILAFVTSFSKFDTH